MPEVWAADSQEAVGNGHLGGYWDRRRIVLGARCIRTASVWDRRLSLIAMTNLDTDKIDDVVLAVLMLGTSGMHTVCLPVEPYQSDRTFD